MDLKNKNIRNARKKWKEIWDCVRTFQGWWRHPKFDFFIQNNQIFKPDIFKYESLPENIVFSYKISKYVTK